MTYVTVSAKSCVSEYWTKGNILGQLGQQMSGQLMIFPFVQYSLMHDLAHSLFELNYCSYVCTKTWNNLECDNSTSLKYFLISDLLQIQTIIWWLYCTIYLVDDDLYDLPSSQLICCSFSYLDSISLLKITMAWPWDFNFGIF